MLEARSMATLFRGYEVIMIGRDPRDAIFITSRACGVCGGVHSTCSALAIEMAIGCRPPKLGIAIRNLALALEFLYDHPLHLHLLAGPDYSSAMIEPTNPALLARARKTESKYPDVHGYRTVGDLMDDLNPLSGRPSWSNSTGRFLKHMKCPLESERASLVHFHRARIRRARLQPQRRLC